MMEFPLLLDPFSIADVKIKNRVVMAPVYTALGSKDSMVTDMMIDYYKERAIGGTGMIVVEAMAVHASGHGMENQVALYKDGVLDGLSKLAKAIKDAGAVAVLQLHHIGKFNTLGKALAPSATTYAFGGAQLSSVEISLQEMDEIKNAFAQAAVLAQKAGFDMVELHGGAGYLLASFFSPHANFRSDDYGGSLEKRARYPLEILKAVKTAVGNKYPVGWRLCADEFLPDGITLEQNLQFVPMLEKAGAAYISPVFGTYESFFLPDIVTLLKKPGYGVTVSGKLKETVKIPVFANGRIIAPQQAEKLLSDNQADAVALGRPLVSDPAFVRKAETGAANTIKACKACDTCMMRIMMGRRIKCDNWK